MTIADIKERGKAHMGRIPPHALTLAILVLATTAAFGLGILAGKDMGSGPDSAIRPITSDKAFWVEQRGAGGATSTPATPSPAPSVSEVGASLGIAGQGFVASKSGTKFYLPTCSGVARIKEENKVWFATRADAEATGRTPAASCPGL
jgi:hypothetical protein